MDFEFLRDLETTVIHIFEINLLKLDYAQTSLNEIIQAKRWCRKKSVNFYERKLKLTLFFCVIRGKSIVGHAINLCLFLNIYTAKLKPFFKSILIDSLQNRHSFWINSDCYEVVERHRKAIRKNKWGFHCELDSPGVSNTFKVSHERFRIFKVITKDEFKTEKQRNPKFRARRGWIDFVIFHLKYISSNKLV